MVSERTVSPEFLTVPRAARLLGVSKNTLRDAVARGDLPAYRIRRRWLRVHLNEAIAWMRSARVEPDPRIAGDRPSDTHHGRERGQ